MSLVIIEQEFSSPLTADDIVRPAEKTRTCMELHGAHPRRHYLAHGGLHCMCVFDAPDAESVRSAYRLADSNLPRGIWAATVHPEHVADSGEAPMLQNPDFKFVLVERIFTDPVSYAEIRDAEDIGADSGKNRAIHYLRSYFSSNRKKMVCVYGAVDVELVLAVNRRARMPFERAWSVELVLH